MHFFIRYILTLLPGLLLPALPDAMPLSGILSPIASVTAAVSQHTGSAPAKPKGKSKSKPKATPKATPKAKAKTKPKAPATPANELDRKRREQAENTAAINQASKQMADNERRAARSLDELNRVSGELKQTKKTLGVLTAGLDSLDQAISAQNDTLARLTSHYERLCQSRREALQRLQRTPHKGDSWSYVLGAHTIGEAYARARYVKVYNDAWRRRTAELREQAALVHQSSQELSRMRREQAATTATIAQERDRLAVREKSERELVQRLRGDNANLKKVLERRRQQARQLEREIDRLVAEELERERREQEERERREAAERQRREQEAAAAAANNGSNGSGTQQPTPEKPKPSKPKPSAPVSTPEADRALTGTFQSNKGKLLFPVRGSYRIVRPFGRSKHPDLPMVETDNSGVDLEVAAGTKARAIFDGTVTGTFKLPGYNTVVIVRHGDYLSLYANLENITVRKGQSVKTGQDLGSVVNDPESTGNPGKTLFHFELRRKRDKINPMEWVK